MKNVDETRNGRDGPSRNNSAFMSDPISNALSNLLNFAPSRLRGNISDFVHTVEKMICFIEKHKRDCRRQNGR
jgi:hypothetical protein